MRFLSVLIAAGLAGCCASHVGLDLGDAGPEVPLDAADAVDAPDTVDVPGDEGGACDAISIAAVDSRQTVRFSFTGSTGSYLVTQGQFCGPIGVDRVDPAGGATPIPMGTPYACPCECPAPPPPGPTAAVPLGGATATPFAWDARDIVLYYVCVDCAARGWPGGGIQSYAEGVWQPVEAGRYRATFAILDGIPPGCSTAADGSLVCYPSGPPGWGPGTFEAPCPASRTVSAEFDLPSAGDVDVPVVVP